MLTFTCHSNSILSENNIMGKFWFYNVKFIPVTLISMVASGGKLGETKASKLVESFFIVLFPLNILLSKQTITWKKEKMEIWRFANLNTNSITVLQYGLCNDVRLFWDIKSMYKNKNHFYHNLKLLTICLWHKPIWVKWN